MTSLALGTHVVHRHEQLFGLLLVVRAACEATHKEMDFTVAIGCYMTVLLCAIINVSVTTSSCFVNVLFQRDRLSHHGPVLLADLDLDLSTAVVVHVSHKGKEKYIMLRSDYASSGRPSSMHQYQAESN